ncbi:Helix-loop-helix DNA-binding domain protein [Paragonimus heterotremus]|uniref:Helix-loop-helix DNA-binding domain protein n=1 Tax=Paragonimus heterotremus TaxID=100268 RepID=A0A8J4WSC8_9TREM|nr:Helix-loop-helix DNA-binding domain protein [Paragonimus heterotremus]
MAWSNTAMQTSAINYTGPLILSPNISYSDFVEETDGEASRMATSAVNSLLLTPGGKRRGRKPGLNSTVAQRSAANARERSRMRVLSGAFVELKGALPWVPKDTKLSKLDTLKLAAGYIAYLRRILDTSSDSDESQNEPDAMLYDGATPNTLHLFNLVTKTTENSKEFPDSNRLFNNRQPAPKPTEFITYPRTSSSSPLLELSTSLGQKLRPFFTLPTDTVHPINRFHQVNKTVVHNSPGQSTTLNSEAGNRVNAHFAQDPLSNFASRELASQRITYRPLESRDSEYGHNRPGQNMVRLYQTISDNSTPSPYMEETVMFNTELSRLLAPSVKTLWNCSRVEQMARPELSSTDIMQSTIRFPPMSESTDYHETNSLTYQSAESQPGPLFQSIATNHTRSLFI